MAVAVAELYLRFMIDLALRSGRGFQGQRSASMANVQSPQQWPLRRNNLGDDTPKGGNVKPIISGINCRRLSRYVQALRMAAGFPSPIPKAPSYKSVSAGGGPLHIASLHHRPGQSFLAKTHPCGRQPYGCQQIMSPWPFASHSCSLHSLPLPAPHCVQCPFPHGRQPRLMAEALP